MTDQEKTKYFTTPIYYVNDKPHIGHAYTTLACDVLARFYRLDGYDVKFLTGTDEHGQKVENSAEKAGKDPQKFVDEVSQNFRDLADLMNFSHDDFIRTTEERHKKSVSKLWEELLARDEIYLGKYAGWYAVRDEAYYAESEIVDGKAPTGADVEWVEEPSYFFRLSKWEKPLLEFYKNNPDFILPKTRRNEVTSFVEGGLKDLSVSRTTFKWGVPVPNDDDHIMYVWLDALTNYLTAVGYPDTDAADYKKFWNADCIHMVGKDILRFHAVYWPAFLMAAELPLPGRVFAHGWWTNEGEKISKSLGNVIDPIELVEQYGLDQVRYFMLREVPFGNDGDFSKRGMVTRINTELANDLGNLVQRVMTQVFRNCDAKIPAAQNKTAEDQAMLDLAYGLKDEMTKTLDVQAFNKALDAVWKVVTAANRYIDIQAPWTLKKTDFTRMEEVLYTLAETIRVIGICVQPFMPESGAKILDTVSVPLDARMLSAIEKSPLVAGTGLEKPAPIFPRIQVEEEEA
ncbi:MAG: methionine--tRNA ligase [Alphaproteobacteria bacterium]